MGAMIRKGTGYRPTAIFLLLRYGLLAVAAVAAPAVIAQDAMPDTPPELRDFKLEPVPRGPVRPPRDEPLIVPRQEQPVPTRLSPVLQPTGPAAQPVASDPAPVSAAPRSTPSPAVASESQSGAAVTTSPRDPVAPGIGDSADAGDLPVGSDIILPPVDGPVPSQDVGEVSATGSTPGFPYWWLLAALAVGAAILFGIRRAMSGRRADDPTMHDAEIVDPLASVIPETTPVEAPKTTVRPRTDTAPAIIDISFVPSTATISINNLIVKGDLQIVNQDNATAIDMRLRSIIISASEVQNEIIEAFHADLDDRYVEKLGDAKPGERIAMEITLSVPLNEIISYQLGNKRLFAPIILANVIYGSGSKGTRYEARLACMIGREANPPTSKMGPLRLDLGPRSFGELGQRPLFG